MVHKLDYAVIEQSYIDNLSNGKILYVPLTSSVQNLSTPTTRTESVNDLHNHPI